MIRMAISGTANSGKDTVARFLVESYCKENGVGKNKTCVVALADPIKKMIKTMFPETSRKVLFGESKYRSSVIPGAYFKGQPLTYRVLLQQLGTEFGRSLKDTVWLDVAEHKRMAAQKRGVELFVITDVRFRNEFDFLKKNGYYMLRIIRGDPKPLMKHSSETEQGTISDCEFHQVIHNNGSLEDFRAQTKQILRGI